MFSIIKYTLKERRLSIALFCIAAFAFVMLYVFLFPTIRTQASAYQELIKSMPKVYLKVFNASNMDLEDFGGYLSTEYLSFLWPLIAILFVVSFAASTLAGEIESRTIGSLLSLPLRRGTIFFAKYFTGIILLAIFTLLSLASIIPLASLNSISYSKHHIIVVCVAAILFMLALFSVGLLISTVCKTKSQASTLTAIILIIMYTCNLLASLTDKLDSLKYFSFFYYFNPTLAITRGQISSQSVIVFLTITVVCTLAASFIFRKQDILV